MRQNVPAKTSLVRNLFLANVAVVVLHDVDAFMSNEAAAAGEAFMADIADIRLDTCMRGLMVTQPSSRRIFFIA